MCRCPHTPIEKDTEKSVFTFLGAFRLCKAHKVVFQCYSQITSLCGVGIRVSLLFFAIYRKKVPGKIPIPFLAQKERLDGFSPVVFALRTVYFMSLFDPQKDGRRVRVSLPFLHYTEKRYRGKSRYLSWRRRRDSTGFHPSCSLCEQFILCPFLLRKKTDEEFESLQTNSYIQKEKAQRKNPCAFSGAEGETRTLAPVTRPTPLAGAPRHQLEYFCIGSVYDTIRLLKERAENRFLF